MFKTIRSPRVLALLALGFVTLSTGALADPYGYGGSYGGNGGYGRPTYGGDGRSYGQPPRSYGDAGYHGPNGYNGGGRHPQYNGAAPQYNGAGGRPTPQHGPQAYNGAPAPQAYPGPRSYYPQGANAPQGAVPHRAPGYGGPPIPPAQPAVERQPQPQQPAPAPAPAASGQPTYVYVVFQQSATAVETASFLRTYNLVVDDGPSNDGFFQLRVIETLPEGQLKEMVESMRTQSKVVSRVES